MITVKIDGTPITLKKNTLNISGRIEQRETAAFALVDTTNTARYYKGQQVVIEKDDVTMFTGTILSSAIAEAMANGFAIHQIRATGHHYAADKRLATKVYTNELAGDIVRDLLTSYLTAEGISSEPAWKDFEGLTWGDI